jgi:hypothetical protein
VTNTLEGRWLTRHVSSEYQLDFIRYPRHEITLCYDALMLGNGSYLVTVATYKFCDLKDLSTAEFYEILARSFRIYVRDALLDDATLFHHPAQWTARPVVPMTSEEPEGMGSPGQAGTLIDSQSASPFALGAKV